MRKQQDVILQWKLTQSAENRLFFMLGLPTIKQNDYSDIQMTFKKDLTITSTGYKLDSGAIFFNMKNQVLARIFTLNNLLVIHLILRLVIETEGVPRASDNRNNPLGTLKDEVIKQLIDITFGFANKIDIYIQIT